MAASGDFSGYLGLGYSQDEVDYLTRLWLKQNPKLLNTWIDAHPEEAARMGIKKKKKKGKSGRGGSSSTGDPHDTLSAAGYSDMDVMNAASNGYNVYNSALSTANALQRATNNSGVK